MLKMLYLPWNLAQRDRFGKSTERKFSWENVEIKPIEDEQNKLKRVRPTLLVRQKSVHAKQQHLPDNLAKIAAIQDKLQAAIHSAIIYDRVSITEFDIVYMGLWVVRSGTLSDFT